MFPVPARPGGRRAKRWPTFHQRAVPQQQYTQKQTIPLLRQGQAKVNASGIAVVSMGPSGVGTKWYPASATFATASQGPSSGCYVGLYNDFVSQYTLMNGALYNGPGDSAGLAVPFITPGNLIVAQWIGGTPGDIVQLTISGTQDLLVTV